MSITYAYSVEGEASGGQTWRIEGKVSVMGRGAFLEAVENAMRSSFMKLTRGQAVFGKPGVGCSGPYYVTKFTIAEKEET